MSYANDYNSYMLDDYGLPSYSRRSSYNYAFGDQIPQPANAYPGGRKLSTASDRSTATKALELPPRFDFSRQNSTASLVSDNGLLVDNRTSPWCSKKVRNAVAIVVLLLGCVVFVLGICLLVFSNDHHHQAQTALGPLGYFFLTLGILIVLLTLSVVFLPYQNKEPTAKFANANLHLLNPSQLPQTISSLELEQQASTEEPNPGTPKITITPETNIGKFPMNRMNAIEDGANKYGESSKGNTAF